VNKYRGMYLYSGYGGGGVQGIGLCGEHIQELHTVYLKRFQTYKIYYQPKQRASYR
jgi:hypothetical protein